MSNTQQNLSSTQLGQQLLEAVKTGNIVHVEKVLKENPNVDVNLLDKNNQAPLHHASKNFNYVFCKLLLQNANINVNLKDTKHSNTPMHYVVKQLGQTPNQQEILQDMIQLPSTDINSQNVSGQTPLHLAITLNRYNFIKVLMDNTRINLNIKDNNGRTPLHIAIKESRHKALKLIIENRSLDIQMLDSENRTYWQYANHYGNRKAKEAISKLHQDLKLEYPQNQYVDPNPINPTQDPQIVQNLNGTSQSQYQNGCNQNQRGQYINNQGANNNNLNYSNHEISQSSQELFNRGKKSSSCSSRENSKMSLDQSDLKSQSSDHVGTSWHSSVRSNLEKQSEQIRQNLVSQMDQLRLQLQGQGEQIRNNISVYGDSNSRYGLGGRLNVPQPILGHVNNLLNSFIGQPNQIPGSQMYPNVVNQPVYQGTPMSASQSAPTENFLSNRFSNNQHNPYQTNDNIPMGYSINPNYPTPHNSYPLDMQVNNIQPPNINQSSTQGTNHISNLYPKIQQDTNGIYANHPIVGRHQASAPSQNPLNQTQAYQQGVDNFQQQSQSQNQNLASNQYKNYSDINFQGQNYTEANLGQNNAFIPQQQINNNQSQFDQSQKNTQYQPSNQGSYSPNTQNQIPSQVASQQCDNQQNNQSQAKRTKCGQKKSQGQSQGYSQGQNNSLSQVQNQGQGQGQTLSYNQNSSKQSQSRLYPEIGVGASLMDSVRIQNSEIYNFQGQQSQQVASTQASAPTPKQEQSKQDKDQNKNQKGQGVQEQTQLQSENDTNQISQQSQSESPLQQQNQEDDSNMCVICISEKVQIGVYHKGRVHYCLCKDCSKQYDLKNKKKQNLCPICRAEIQDLVEVF